MYSVFLVDDEPIVLEGLRSKIDWDNSGFSFAGEATDGEIALSMIREIKPDILITDIKMPFMDGLTLASSVKKIQPWIKIVVLSGHDEFDYAKKAISIGVEEYLLKPFTIEEVIASLNKISNVIDKERRQLSDISLLKEELKRKDKLVEKEFFNDLIHGLADTQKIMEKCSELGIDLMSRCYKILISRVFSKSGDAEKVQETCSLLSSYTSSWDNTNSFFHHQNWLVCICKGMNQTEVDENIFHVAENIEHIVAQNGDCVVVTGIGKTVEHLSSLNESYEDAKKMVELGDTEKHDKSSIVSSDDVVMTDTGLQELKEKDPMVLRLRYASQNDIDTIFDETMALINSNPEHFQFFASYLLTDLIFAVSKLVESLGGNLKEENPEIVQRSFVERGMSTREAFKERVRQVLDFAREYRDSKMTGKYSDVILKAKKYIEENYADPNTTLTTVADVVCMSPNHFSTIFSQQCKTTFIEYLTNVRLENAKRLLRNSDKKGYDIAYECGFSDPHYFSFIFKKNTGLTPREYKGSF